jgi:hypothetical protein
MPAFSVSSPYFTCRGRMHRIQLPASLSRPVLLILEISKRAGKKLKRGNEGRTKLGFNFLSVSEGLILDFGE